ncbi:hypothetical protein [Porphyromonas sp. COT-108 OH1349]|uniref:hypothetical protein n=1 Tax=Porphyromonas sp. COT-108 OH1349 TaxID=1537504 RepID=UPI001F2882C8|nr:hypothetical protein [Porphyromonas sp. COT-108 OH1349]
MAHRGQFYFFLFLSSFRLSLIGHFLVLFVKDAYIQEMGMLLSAQYIFIDIARTSNRFVLAECDDACSDMVYTIGLRVVCFVEASPLYLTHLFVCHREGSSNPIDY